MHPLLAVAPFAIHVLDRAGNPAPCVQLTTTDRQVHVSDPTGWVAFHEPGLMDRRVWFTVESGAYSHPPDFFGFEGVALDVTEGGQAEIRVDRDRAPGPCPAPDARPILTDGYTDRPFDLHVVDAATGRGVPLIRVDGPHGAMWTDSAGHVAIRHPELLDAAITLEIPALHGYRHVGGPIAVTPTEGGVLQVQVERDNVAERLYRVTGRGVYRDSVLLGLTPPTAEPLLNGRVTGQDTVMAVPYQGGWMWMFGDTNKEDYPLGLFEMAAAVIQPLPDPADGVDLVYFEDRNGFARAMAPMPGSSPNWLTGPMLVEDAAGDPVVATLYMVVNADLSPSDRGVAVFDEANAIFEPDVSWGPIDLNVVINPPIVRGGQHYLKERFRFPATLEALRDPRTWESWTPELADGTVELRPDGEPWYRWRSGVTPEQHELDRDDLLEHTTGDEVIPHYDSVAWSPWRHRWHRIFTEQWSSISFLGEMWYAEADTPFGPWTRATKIATHDVHTSYNPQIHVELETDGREILWQATYTTTFSAGAEPTPLYDYNQMMYRLDLEDPRVNLPIPVYDRDGATGLGARLGTIADLRPGDPEPKTAFLAPDRAFPGSLPVGWDGPACDGGRPVVGGGLGTPAFHVADPGADAPVGAVSLWRATDGAVEGWFVTVPAGFAADPAPLGYVWPNDGPAYNGVLDWLPEVRVDAGADVCAAEPLLGEGAVVAVDASASPGTAGGTWSITLDGVEVATTPTADVTVPAGRHALVVRWTSPMGTPYTDDVLVAVAEGPPPPEETGDTGDSTTDTDPGTDTDTDAPATDGPDDTGVAPTDGGEDPGGCGCASGPTTGGLPVLGLLALARRRRRA